MIGLVALTGYLLACLVSFSAFDPGMDLYRRRRADPESGRALWGLVRGPFSSCLWLFGLSFSSDFRFIERPYFEAFNRG